MSKAFELAKKFYEDNWNEKHIKIHTELVIDCCLNMAKNTNLKPEVF